MFDIYDENGTFQRFTKAGVALRGIDGKLFANASAQPVAVLNAHGIYPVNDPGKPSQEWQVVTGMKRTINTETGNSDWSYQVTPLSLNAGKDKLRAKVKAYRDTAMFGGYHWQNTAGDSFVIDTDNVSQARLNGYYNLALAGRIENGSVWRTKDNSTPILTSDEIIDLAIKIGEFVGTCYNVQAGLEASIDALDDLDACKAFDCAEGFPAVPVMPSA